MHLIGARREHRMHHGRHHPRHDPVRRAVLDRIKQVAAFGGQMPVQIAGFGAGDHLELGAEPLDHRRVVVRVVAAIQNHRLMPQQSSGVMGVVAQRHAGAAFAKLGRVKADLHRRLRSGSAPYARRRACRQAPALDPAAPAGYWQARTATDQTHARPADRTLFRGNPGADAGAGRRRPETPDDRGSGRGRSHLCLGGRLRHPAPAGAVGRGADGGKPDPARGTQGPAHRCARGGHRRLPALDRPDPRTTGGPRCRQGPGLVRAHRTSRPPGRGHHRRSAGACDPQFPLAKVDAMGRRQLALGAAAAFDPLPALRSDDGRSGAAQRRRHRGRRHHPRSPLHVAWRDFGNVLR